MQNDLLLVGIWEDVSRKRSNTAVMSQAVQDYVHTDLLLKNILKTRSVLPSILNWQITERFVP